MSKRRCPNENELELPSKKQKGPLYMVDYTPIRTIEVTNLEDDTTTEYLRGFFEGQVGPVSNVSIEHHGDNKRIRVGHVTFVMPEDAARMIGEPNQLINCKFTVAEAETSYQPKIDPNSLKFEEINDDCLRKITTYLSLIDIINMGKTSTRLRSFTQQAIYQQRKQFCFDSYASDSVINETNVELILRETGTYIESISWCKLEPHHLDFLSRYCPNVTELELLEASNLCNYEKNRNFFAKIETLKIWLSSLSDAHVSVIASSRHLKSLSFEHCEPISGAFFSEWKHSEIKILKLEDCQFVNSDEVFNFVSRNRLVKFSAYYPGYFEKCLRLPSTCLSLFEELELNIPFNFKQLSLKENHELKMATLNFKYLTNLKHLRLTGRDRGNCNEILVAAAQIPALTSLTVEGIGIDEQTLQCLGSFSILKKIRFNFCENKIGGLLYSLLYVYLPEITDVTMDCDWDEEEILHGINRQKQIVKEKSISAMISHTAQLKYFAYSDMTWELLDKILEVQIRLKRPIIEIGIPESFSRDQRKKAFDLKCKGAIRLSVYDEVDYEAVD